MMGDHDTEAGERAAMINGHQKMTADSLPWLTTDQMVEVDRIMIEDLQIELKQMMENAGRNLAASTQQLVAPARVVVMAGSGGNRGGGLVAARHLANHGNQVHVVVARPAMDFWGVPSLDVPSGVGSSTGEAPGAAIRADATLTLAAPKVGLRDNPLVGRLFVADISVPPSVYPQLGVRQMPAFRTGWIAEVVDTAEPASPAGLSES